MSTTIDTFIHLKRDIEQSFQRVQALSNSSRSNPHELDQLLNHISCTLDDLEKINQLLQSSSNLDNTHPLNLSDNEDDFDDKTKLIPSSKHNKDHEKVFLSSNSLTDEHEEFIRRMKTQLDYYKNKVSSTRNDGQMEIIRLDQAAEEETEDQIIRKQDEQLNDFHLSIVSLKNLTQNINLEINDHIRVLDNLETNLTDSQNHVVNLTTRTKHFLQTSADGIAGHTCLFSVAVILFFLIVILILFF